MSGVVLRGLLSHLLLARHAAHQHRGAATNRKRLSMGASFPYYSSPMVVHGDPALPRFGTFLLGMGGSVILPQKGSDQKQNFLITRRFCLKKPKFTDSQIMEALKRVEAGTAVSEWYRDMGINSATFYKWRAKYGGMDTSMTTRMEELEQENARLKAEILREATRNSQPPIKNPAEAGFFNCETRSLNTCTSTPSGWRSRPTDPRCPDPTVPPLAHS